VPVISSFIRKAFSSRLAYLQVLAVFFAFGLMVLASFMFGLQMERGHLEDEVEALFISIESQLQADLKELETMTGMISQSINMQLSQGAGLEEMKVYISGITEYSKNKGIPGFLSVFAYFDIPGQIERNAFSAISPETDWHALEEAGIFIVEERDWYILASAAKGQIVVTPPYVDMVTGEVALAYARGLYDNAGNLIAIVGLNILLDRIYEFSYELRRDSPITWMMLDENMTIIAFPFPEFIGVPLRDAHATGISGIADKLEQNGFVFGDRFLSRDGSTKIHNVRRLDNGWYIGVATPIYHYISSLQFILWFLIALGLIMATGLSFILLRLLAGKDKALADKNLLVKLSMAMEVGKVFLWEMELIKDDPLNFSNPVIWPDGLRFALGYKNETDFPNSVGTLVNRLHPEDMEMVPNAFIAHLLDKTDQTPYNLEYRLQKKNGGYVYIHATGKTIRDKDGNPLHTVGTIIDITPMKNFIFEAERQRAEAELRLIKLNLALNAADAHIWETKIASDDQDVINDTSAVWPDGLRHVLGYNDETDFPNVISSLVNCLHPDDVERVPAAANAHILDKTGQTPYDIEYRLQKKNGDYVYIHATGETIRDSEGNPLHTVGTIIDITSEKILINKAEKQREEAEYRLIKLNMAMEAGNIFMWEMDIMKNDPLNPNNKLIIPDEFRYLLGYKDENEFPNLASSLFKCMHPDDWKWVPDAVIGHLMDKTGQTPYNVEYRVLKKNGECVYIHATGKTIRDESGNPLRTAGTIIDITPMKKLIFDAERNRMEAEAANKAKSEFLSHISHEIRTPMNAILGTAEIQLQKDTNSPEIDEAFNMVYSSGNLLLNIINDILDLSKIEAGKLEIIPAQYDIPSIIYDTVQLNLLRYDSKPIEFDLKIDKDTPLDLLGDELRIKQILNNILSNAFKYTDKGKVELSVSALCNEIPGAGTERTPCMLILRITDTGQGMSEGQINKLFDEYTRFNMDTNRTIVGTGLGMHITKRLIDVMNGEISVESELNKGSVFLVRLPQERIGSSVCGAELAEKLRSSRFKNMLKLNRAQIVHEYMPYGSVLIVDDVESNLYVAKGMMLPYGLNIETVSSGFEAIDRIKAGKIYDIIFMDHMMPKMNGLEATKIIREMGYTHPIVALTANAVTGSSVMFLSNGLDGFISKPIDIRELNASLNRLIRDKQPPEVIEESRQKVKLKLVSGKELNTQISNEIIKSVLRDIEKTIAVLEDILPKIKNQDDAEVNLFTINVHSMKSVLLNIGEKELSTDAFKLEQAGDDGRIEEILTDTPPFINLLKLILNKYKTEKLKEADDVSFDDMVFLKDKLIVIKTACENMKKKDAKTAMDDLRKKTWTQKINRLLDEISVNLLHGEFKEVISAAEKAVSAQEF